MYQIEYNGRSRHATAINVNTPPTLRRYRQGLAVNTLLRRHCLPLAALIAAEWSNTNTLAVIANGMIGWSYRLRTMPRHQLE